jgi:hypothetical protein
MEIPTVRPPRPAVARPNSEPAFLGPQRPTRCPCLHGTPANFRMGDRIPVQPGQW